MPTTARAVGFCVLAHAGGEERRDGQGQRPATGDVVGRRRQVEGEAGDEAEHQRERRLDGQRGCDHHEQAQVGHDAVPGDVREQRDLHDERDDDGGEGDQQRGHLSSQAPVGLDHGAVAVRAARHHHADHVEGGEVHERLDTARWEASRSEL